MSPTFYAWIFQFEGDIIIQSPQKAIDDFIKTAEKLLRYIKESAQYNEISCKRESTVL